MKIEIVVLAFAIWSWKSTDGKVIINDEGIECTAKVADIVVAMDTSGSIWEDQFQSQLHFVQKVVRHFRVGENAVRVGVLTFGTDVYPQIYLDDYFNADEVIEHISHIPYRGGGTNTGAAIKYARDVMFSTKHGGRDNVAKINVIITDGFSLDFENTTLEASISRSLGIQIMAVGIGFGIDAGELKYIASNGEDVNDKLVFTVDSFSLLDDIDHRLTTRACYAIQNDQPTDAVDSNDPDTIEVHKSCGGKPADVFFVVDSSSSVWPADYKKMLSFITDVVAMFDLSPGATRIGLVAYSDGIHPFISIENLLKADELRKRILNIPHLQGGTKTGSALQYLRQSGLKVARKSVAHVVIVLTDGQSSDTQLTAKESRLLREMGVYVIAVGIGEQVDRSELASMSSVSDSSSVFHISDFSALFALKNILAIKTCTIQDEEGSDLQKDEGMSNCQFGASMMDVVFLYDGQSLDSDVTSQVVSVISELMASFSNMAEDIRVGILSDLCDQKQNLSLSSYKTTSEIKNHLIASQEKNLPLLVKEVRTRGFDGQNGGRNGAKKVAVLFIDGHKIHNYKQLHLEIRRLTHGKAVEVFVVHTGSDSRDIRKIGSHPRHNHVITVSAFDSDKIYHHVLSKLCSEVEPKDDVFK